MLDSFTCPFCKHTMPVVSSTYTEMDARYRTQSKQGYLLDTKYSLKIHMYKCPNCQKITSIANYTGTELPQKTVPLFPISTAKQFPDYIPQAIRSDYEEASSIVNLSPKASATLSRRYLQ